MISVRALLGFLAVFVILPVALAGGFITVAAWAVAEGIIK